MPEFSFKFTVDAKELANLGPQEKYLVPEEFVTISGGLALIWNLEVFPRGTKCNNLRGLVLGIRRSSLGDLDYSGGVWARLTCRLTSNGQSQTRKWSRNQYKANWILKTFADLPAPTRGHLKGQVTLCPEPLCLEEVFPPAPTVKPKPSSLGQTLLCDIASPEVLEWADVLIACSDGELGCSRLNLCLHSPYYQAAFRTKDANGIDTGKLDHSAYSRRVVTEFLRCLYAGGVTSSVLLLSTEEKMDLLTLADEVESAISPKIIEVLEREVTLWAWAPGVLASTETALSLLRLATLHGLSLLANLALAALSGRLHEIPTRYLPSERRLGSGLSEQEWQSLGRLNAGRLRVHQLDASDSN